MRASVLPLTQKISFQYLLNYICTTNKNKEMQLQHTSLSFKKFQRAGTIALSFTLPTNQMYFQNITELFICNRYFLSENSFNLKWHIQNQVTGWVCQPVSIIQLPGRLRLLGLQV